MESSGPQVLIHGYDAGGSFGSSDGVFSMLEESVKDVLATTGNSAVANFRFANNEL